jgi:hypothetical protein
MKSRQNSARRISAIPVLHPHLCAAAALALLLSGCTTISDPVKGLGGPTQTARTTDPFEHSKALVAAGKYDEAYKENQRILSEGRGPRDVALFNMGLISAYSSNPRKNYSRALVSFRSLVAEHPGSSLAEHAKMWIQVLEEHQKLIEERQRILDDKQKLLEERRALIRERETLSQEKEKIKYTVEKTRQVDIEIEKRRRQALTK